MEYILVIIINLLILLLCYLYYKFILKMAGEKSKDEMYKYFYGNAFKKIGIILTTISGISLFINIFIMNTYSGNIPKDVLAVRIQSDYKYLLIATVFYIYYLIKLKLQIRKNNRED